MATVNDILRQSGEVNFEIVSIGAPRSFPKRDGGTYEAQNVELMVPATRQVFDVRMFPNFVQHLKVGGLVKGISGEKFPKWEYVKGGEAALSAPEASNQQQVKNERSFSQKAQKQHDRSAEIGFRGILQACIIAFGDEAYAKAEYFDALVHDKFNTKS